MNIRSITIERFKGLRSVSIRPSRVTVLTGPNNSGKSSVLQALQFGTSIAQSAKAYSPRLAAGTLAVEQLMYTPLRDVEALAPNGIFTQARHNAISIALEIEMSGTVLTTSIKVSRGKNRNLSFLTNANVLAHRIADMDNPFSVYVTGLAGIPRQEEFRSQGLVRKAASRGDANSVLRNVLLLLSNDTASWAQFIADLQQVFPGINVTVEFDAAVDDYIEVKTSLPGSVELPIDAAGTGVLQTIQILAYVNVYKPALLLLDEPDSHLHPTNQRRLAKVLTDIAERRNFQILLTTHSRHLLDELSASATTLWFDSGKPISDKFDYIQALIDLGAVDKLDSLTHLNAIILTEDENTAGLDALTKAVLKPSIRYEIRSYSGSSNITNTLLLADFLHEKFPHLQIVVHRDRDYILDQDIESLVERLEKGGVIPLITENVDVESLFTTAAHVHEVYPELTPKRCEELVQLAINSARHVSIEKLTNARVKQAASEAGGIANVNHGRVARHAEAEYEANPIRFSYGKAVLGHLIALIQAELGKNPILLLPTRSLAKTDEALVLATISAA